METAVDMPRGEPPTARGDGGTKSPELSKGTDDVRGNWLGDDDPPTLKGKGAVRVESVVVSRNA